MTLCGPHQPTLANYIRIFTDESWYSGYIHSLNYVLINTVISISFALPAAYAFFSRYRFPRRQASLLLAIVEPDGAAGGCSSRCRSSTCIRRSICSIRRGAVGTGALPVQRAAGGCGFSKDLCPACRGGDRRRDRVFSTVIRSQSFFIKISGAADRQRHRRRGVFSASCFSWVELLLARTLTSVNAKNRFSGG